MPLSPFNVPAGLLLPALLLLAGCGDEPTREQQPIATEIRLLSGADQVGTPGWPLPDSIVVEVLDAGGNQISGMPVSWNATNGGDLIGPAADTTDAAGRVAAAWTLGLGEGQQTLSISTAGVDPITATATATIFHALSVTVGGGFACAITESSGTFCWGNNDVGQLGTGTTGSATLTPMPVAGGVLFNALTASAAHACGLTAEGATYCWGSNDRGETGTGTTSPSVPAPTAVQTDLRFTLISAEGLQKVSISTCALTAEGEAWCWGDNTFGQLGNGTTDSSAVPVQVASAVSFSSITTGYFHTCAIATTGELWCWGEQEGAPGAFGSLATGIYSSPVTVHPDSRFLRLALGRNFTCGIDAGNAAFCWGANFSGNLGNGETGEGSAAPVPVVGGHLFSALTAPSFKEVHGLSFDGGLFRWGSPGGDVPQSTPTLVAQLGFIQIDSGDFPFDAGLGACGITDLNTVYCVRDDGVVRGVPEVGSPAPSP